MGKLLGIDFGQKRCGLALSDDLAMISSPLKTVDTSELMSELEKLLKHEDIVGIVLGYPRDLKGGDTDITEAVRSLSGNISRKFEGMSVYLEDERFTSKLALDSMIAGNVSKSKRRDKSMIDKVSASLILQSFLDRQTRT